MRWHVAIEGSVSVTNSNDLCSTEKITLNVTLIDPDNEDNNFSVARLWNEVLLQAVRNDFARPTIHARNLFHTSIAMYDAWAIYNDEAQPYLIGKEVHGFSSTLDELNIPEATLTNIEETISYAAYKILSHRFKDSPNSEFTLNQFDDLMTLLNLDISFTSTDYSDGNPASLGNYIAAKIIEYGFQDGSNEFNFYNNIYYEPVNDPWFRT